MPIATRSAYMMIYPSHTLLERLKQEVIKRRFISEHGRESMSGLTQDYIRLGLALTPERLEEYRAELQRHPEQSAAAVFEKVFRFEVTP